MADSASSSSANGDKNEKLMIRILSSDKKEILLEEDVARKSEFLSNMLDLTSANQEKLQEALDIPNYDAETLEKVFEWCALNRDKVGRVKNPQEPRINLTEEEMEYMKIPNAQLLKVLLCANYLNIGELIEIVTQKVANMASGKNVEQMRKIYMLKNDLTPEEEEEIRKRHEWCEMR